MFFFVCSGFVFFCFFVKPYILCVVGPITLVSLQRPAQWKTHCTLSTKQKSPQPSISSKLFWRFSLLISSHLNVSNPRKMKESILNPSSSLFGSVPKPPAARVKIKLHDAIRNLDNLLTFTSTKVRPAMGIFPTHTYIYIYIYTYIYTMIPVRSRCEMTIICLDCVGIAPFCNVAP